uniref:Uncharacterized protein n=1 Tax=Haraldiophyllum bonnemaisonii TaxID=167977 RepID=A0A4D6WUB6_9FLOR|nr:hypothetical protein [Haraldiophyllum bonnemaisonii]
MENKFFTSYCFFKTVSHQVFNRKIYIAEEYSDKIFSLINPRLIISLSSNNFKANSSLKNTNKSSFDVNTPATINLSHKVDKKYKNNDNNISVKKNKIKVSKKNRKNLALDKEEIFIDNNDKFFNNKPLHLSLNNSHKF